jgi:hypothetical protein
MHRNSPISHYFWETEISYLQMALLVEKQILRFL